MPIGGPLVAGSDPRRGLQSRPSAPPAELGPELWRPLPGGTPSLIPLLSPCYICFSPLRPTDPHAHQCLIHGPHLLLGVGVLPLPHIDLQAPLVQDITVLQVGEKDQGGSLRVRTGRGYRVSGTKLTPSLQASPRPPALHLLGGRAGWVQGDRRWGWGSPDPLTS